MSSIPHRSAAERGADGRAARRSAPRSDQSVLDLPAGRDPVALLEAQDATRVPELVPIRYGRMLASPFAFFRGAAAVMAARPRRGARTRGCRRSCAATPICSNFGGFASPERRLVFDVNDFDETLPGPVRVGRQAARRELRGRRRATAASATPSGAQRCSRRRALLPRGDATASRRWATSTSGTRASTREPSLDVLRAGHDARAREAARARASRRRARSDSLRALAKLTHDGRRRAAVRRRAAAARADRRARGESIDRVETLGRARSSGSYRDARSPTAACCSSVPYVDARKVVGVGSVGTRCWIVLLLGPRRPRTRCSCRSRRPSRRCSSRSPAGVREPRPAGRRGPAAHAGGERHLPRLGARPTDSTASRATSTSASCGTGRARPTSRRSDPRGLDRLRAGVRVGARARARALGRPGRDRRLPRRERQFDDAIAGSRSRTPTITERDHASLVQAAADGRVSALDGITEPPGAWTVTARSCRQDRTPGPRIPPRGSRPLPEPCPPEHCPAPLA